MTTKKLTKLLALYLPYILLGLVATNFGEAWRLAEGKELGDKIMSMVGTLPGGLCESAAQLASALDLLVGSVLRRRVTAGGLFAWQKRKEVPARHGVRLCPVGHTQGH